MDSVTTYATKTVSFAGCCLHDGQILCV